MSLRQYICPDCNHIWWENCDAENYPNYCPECGHEGFDKFIKAQQTVEGRDTIVVTVSIKHLSQEALEWLACEKHQGTCGVTWLQNTGLGDGFLFILPKCFPQKPEDGMPDDLFNVFCSTNGTCTQMLYMDSNSPIDPKLPVF